MYDRYHKNGNKAEAFVWLSYELCPVTGDNHISNNKHKMLQTANINHPYLLSL